MLERRGWFANGREIKKLKKKQGKKSKIKTNQPTNNVKRTAKIWEIPLVLSTSVFAGGEAHAQKKDKFAEVVAIFCGLFGSLQGNVFDGEMFLILEQISPRDQTFFKFLPFLVFLPFSVF